MSVTLPPKSHSKKAYSDERLSLKAPCLKARACLPGRESQHLVQRASPQSELLGQPGDPELGSRFPAFPGGSGFTIASLSMPAVSGIRGDLKKNKNKKLYLLSEYSCGEIQAYSKK